MSFDKWKECTLGDLVKFQRGHDLTVSNIEIGPYPVAGSNGPIGYHNEFTTKGPSLTLGRSGNSIGVAHFYVENFWAHNTTLYAKDFFDADPKFIYYLLKTIDFKGHNSGSAVPSLNRNLINPYKLKVPSLQTQRRIASILTSIDDKIELNRQTAQTLEAIAQAIFKEWFVDFNFPGATGEMQESELGKIPKGWKVGSLDSVADFLNGLALQKYPVKDGDDYWPVIKIRELKNGVTDNTDKANKNVPEKYVIDDGDLLFSWSGTLEVKFWIGGKGALNQHLFKVIPNKYPLWFCYLWTLHHLSEFRKIAEDKTTTMGHIQRRHLTEALCLIPNDIKLMDSIIAPITDQYINLEQQTKTLILLRDTLLPKLMKGELQTA